MKEIPKRENMRSRAKQLNASNSDHKNNEKQHSSVSVEDPPKTKKIHHQTLKALQRKRLAQEQKSKQEDTNKKEEQVKPKNVEEQIMKNENGKKLVKKDVKGKGGGKGTKQGKKGGKGSKREQVSRELEKYPPNIDSIGNPEKGNNNQNENQQKHQNSNQNYRIQQQVKAEKAKKPVRAADNTDLSYYDNYYDHIFDVLRPLDEVEEQCLIFDKSKPVQYWQLINNIKNQPDPSKTQMLDQKYQQM